MTASPQWRPATPEAAWWAGKSADDLRIIEIGGRKLYPDVVQDKHPASGKVREVPILVHVPHALERATARVDALIWCGKIMRRKAGEYPTIEEAKAVLGAAYFEHLDTICLLSHCIHDPTPPHDRHALPDILDEWYETESLYGVYQRLDYMMLRVSPVVKAQSEEEMLAVVHAIARRQDVGPLVGIDGSALNAFIISMASRLASSLTPKSSSP